MAEAIKRITKNWETDKINFQAKITANNKREKDAKAELKKLEADIKIFVKEQKEEKKLVVWILKFWA